MRGLRRLLWILNFCVIACISFLAMVLLFPQERKPIDTGEDWVNDPIVERDRLPRRVELSAVSNLAFGELRTGDDVPTQLPVEDISAHIYVENIIVSYKQSGEIDTKYTFASIRWRRKGNLLDWVSVNEEIEIGGLKWLVVEVSEQAVKFRSGDMEKVLFKEGASPGSTPFREGTHTPGSTRPFFDNGSYQDRRFGPESGGASSSASASSPENVGRGSFPVNPSPSDFNTYEKSANHWIVDRRERDFYLQNEEEMIQQKMVEGKPYVLSDGSMGGVQITSINHSLLAQRGFKPGDVIKSVNGRRIDSTETALSIYRDPAIRNASRLTVEVERSGRTITIVYEFR